MGKKKILKNPSRGGGSTLPPPRCRCRSGAVAVAAAAPRAALPGTAAPRPGRALCSPFSRAPAAPPPPAPIGPAPPPRAAIGPAPPPPRQCARTGRGALTPSAPPGSSGPPPAAPRGASGAAPGAASQLLCPASCWCIKHRGPNWRTEENQTPESPPTTAAPVTGPTLTQKLGENTRTGKFTLFFQPLKLQPSASPDSAVTPFYGMFPNLEVRHDHTTTIPSKFPSPESSTMFFQVNHSFCRCR